MSVHEDTADTKAQRYNEVVRASGQAGYSILNTMEEDLVEAWIAHDIEEDPAKQRVVRGRVRGIAQCIALIRSPYSRRDLGPRSRAWMEVIKNQENEGHARARLRMRSAS